MPAWTCSACSASNSAEARFCGQCGEKASAGAQQPAGWTCASCQGANPAASKFCGHCGSSAPTPAAGRLEDERRLVTALFADISGFTALSESLDPEALMEVIDPVIAALSAIVGRHDGHVDKYAGDALLAYFGAPVAHDDDAERTLQVAVEMHEEMARIRSTLAHACDLTLRIGVNTGHAVARVFGSEVRMDYSILGDAVNVAQRLESQAPPGETYVGEATRRLVASIFSFKDAGQLSLKGKAEHVQAWCLQGRILHVEDDRAMVGRDDELRAVLEAVSAGNAVAVSGEPGVGKSRLTREAHRRTGLSWLQTRCLSYGRELPYWPYAELLRRSSAPPNPFFSTLLGDQELGLPDLTPEALRRGLHEAFEQWLLSRAPCVLAIEDAHWLDASSLELTKQLARRFAGTSVSLYLTTRGDPPVDSQVVHLEPLDQSGLAAIVEALLGAEPPSELIDAIAERSGGNPFFAEELIRSLKDAGTLEQQQGGVWGLSAPLDESAVPGGIEATIAARLDALPPNLLEVLQLASVAGRMIDVPLLEAMKPGADTVTPLLVDRGFLDRRGSAYMFHHALAQEVVYGRMLRRRRREVHLQVAEAAERLYGSEEPTVALLAHHFYLASVGERAFPYLLASAAAARRLFANDEAVLHLERAIETRRDTAVLLELADMHQLLGRYDEALALYGEVSAQAGDVRAWRGLVGTLRRLGRVGDAYEALERAAASLPHDPEATAHLSLERAATLSHEGQLAAAGQAARSGLEARDVEDQLTAELLLLLANVQTDLGVLAEAEEHCFHAQRIFAALGDMRGEAVALRNLGSVQLSLEQWDRAAETLRTGLAKAGEVGTVEEIGGCLINLALVELERGEVQASITFNERAAEEFTRVGHRSGLAIAHVNLAEALVAGGYDERALELCELAREEGESMSHSQVVAAAAETMAKLHLRAGRYLDAATRAEDAALLLTELGAIPSAIASFELAIVAWSALNEPEKIEAVRRRMPAPLSYTA